MVTAGDLLTPLKKYVSSYLEELGTTSTAQDAVLYSYLSLALKKLAHLAYQTRMSDVLTISTDGDQTFTVSGVAITDMYAPLRIMDSSGREAQNRTSYSAPTGWYCESSNRPIHTKGLTGVFTLHYVFYPASITSSSDPVQFPESAMQGLMYYAAAMTLESRPNAKELVMHYYNIAQQHLKIAVLANSSAKGKGSGGYVPSLTEVDQYFKG